MAGVDDVGVFIPNILNPSHSSYLPAHEDETDRLFRNVGI